MFSSASRGFLREFAVKLKTIHLPPGDYILYNGDEVNTLYFITRGTIEIVDDRDFILAILGKYAKSLFGKIKSIFTNIHSHVHRWCCQFALLPIHT